MQIDPNTQAPIGTTAVSESVNAPVPTAGKRRSKKERKVAPKRLQVDGMADVADAELQAADSATSAVLESTDLEAVNRRLRGGAYNTREVAEVIARRLLASGDL